MINADDRLDYIEQVFDRARRLVQTRVWDDIKEHRLEGWIGCLQNQDAELLGAYLLDNLCFRSRDQFYSMLDSLFLDLPAFPSTPGRGGRLTTRLRSRPKLDDDAPVRLAPVIGMESPPTKSGPYILRLAQRRYGIHSDWLAWPHLLEGNDKLSDIVFVDDFCGTGKQFVDFASSIRLRELHSQKTSIGITYLTAAAHEDGIRKIHDELPFVEVRCVERLGPVTSVLGDDCFARYQIDGFRELVLEQYENVTKRCGLPTTGKFAKGFGELGLAYAFAHATPNNTLPIFWWETDDWTPLLER
ncbi:hypothetical protein KDX09_37235 [Burkholderia cenocepacia]|uniref:phosphoribosyltransferase-like protein n=1 Tax=Burkholderia cenocepacia TaxID=95486 RepID=UPI001B951CB8|nr:hypothetical protein [Burkholderia cenocepacia]MBR8094983.1 hypothetical protein [Burkholderia cenocepacia]